MKIVSKQKKNIKNLAKISKEKGMELAKISKKNVKKHC